MGKTKPKLAGTKEGVKTTLQNQNDTIWLYCLISCALEIGEEIAMYNTGKPVNNCPIILSLWVINTGDVTYSLLWIENITCNADITISWKLVIS